MYDAKTGRFISADPIHYSNTEIKLAGGKNLQTFLSNPQNLNRYTYCLNNPLRYIDPDGLLTILIHGTYSSSKHLNKKKQFIESVEKTFQEKYTTYLFPWDGKNTHLARIKAAKFLEKYINQYKFTKGEKLNIVAHSHGGNIAFLTSNLKLKHKINTLVTLGSPIREYSPNISNIDKIFNVFSSQDWVQTKGGKNAWYELLLPGEAGQAGRTLHIDQVNVLNINISGVNHEEFTTKETWGKIFK